MRDLRTFAAAAVLISAGALGACHPVHRTSGNIFGHNQFGFDHGPMRAVARLNCPDEEGRLNRTSEAPDGRTCQYAGPDDETVTLSLVALNGQSPQAALAPIEAQLKSAAPGVATDSAWSASTSSTVTQTTTTSNGVGVNVSASKDKDNDNERTDIDLPFLHIHTHGQKAQVHVPGVNIDADDNTDQAHITTGWGGANTSINAHHGGAEIRVGDVDKNGANLVYVLAADNPGPDGYKARGYIARGPASGPLVVGEFKAKDDHHEHHGGRDLERLINLNVEG